MNEQANANNAYRRAFLPAKPSPVIISAAQELIRLQLTHSDKLHLDPRHVDVLTQLPSAAGVILASNHADETDPRVCLELSRRSGRRFITMCNREAFDEMLGFAGWVLQRLGYFSVERGARDSLAKAYAIDVVRRGRDVLVVFPEGEIFYQNEKLQHFHVGTIDICMRAVADKRAQVSDWTAYVVPMLIKYHYSRPIEDELNKRISCMERDLAISPGQASLKDRLLCIAGKLIQRKAQKFNLDIVDGTSQDLTQQIRLTEDAIFEDVEQRHKQFPVSPQSPMIDRSWKLAAEIQQQADSKPDSISRQNLRQDLNALREVAQLSSWSPQYLRGATSNDRLAESVIKLERELYRIRRPRPIGGRDIFVTIAEPMDMAQHMSAYTSNAQDACLQATQQLREKIQGLLDKLE